MAQPQRRRRAECGGGMGRGSAAVLLLTALLVGSLPVFPTAQAAPSAIGGVKALTFHDDLSLTRFDPTDTMNSWGIVSPPAIANLDYDNDNSPGVTLKRNASGPPIEQRYHQFRLTPLLARPWQLLGAANATIWIEADKPLTDFVLRASIETGIGAAIARAWINATFATSPTLYLFNFSGIDASLSTGDAVVFNLTREDTANVDLFLYYDQFAYPAALRLTATEALSLDSLESLDVGLVPKGIFAEGESVVLRAVAASPLGREDLPPVTGVSLAAGVSLINVTNATGAVVILGPVGFAHVASDLGPFPAWKRYELGLGSFAAGTYTARVAARDLQGTSLVDQLSFSVLRVDHFDLATPPTIQAGQAFALTVTAKDASNATLAAWTGTVTLVAYLEDRITAAPGTLGITAVSIVAGGTATVGAQTYTASGRIVLRAFKGAQEGWSAPIASAAGPVTAIELAPSGPLILAAGTALLFQAEAHDSLGNVNTTWTPLWTLSGPLGTINGTGTAVTFLPTTVGNGSLEVRDPASGFANATGLSVTAGGLDALNLFPSQIRLQEGLSTPVGVSGADRYGNPVSLPSVEWEVTLGTIAGAGTSVLFHAGFVQGTGLLRATVGAVSATVPVTVDPSPSGPQVTVIPAQLAWEDTPWQLNLAALWSDPNGPDSGLIWFTVELNTSLLTLGRSGGDNALVLFSPQPNAHGSETVRLWIRDLEGYTTYRDFFVIVRPIDDPPEFVNSPPQTLTVKFDTPDSFDYGPFLRDVDTPSAQLVLSVVPPSSAVLLQGLVATFQFPDRFTGSPYTEYLELRVSDGYLSDNLSLTVRVGSNAPPQLLAPLPALAFDEGTVGYLPDIDLDDYFTDPEGETLSFAVSFAPFDVIVAPLSHVVAFSSSSEWAGSVQLFVFAADPAGGLAVGTWNVTVSPVPDPPRITPIPPIQVQSSAPYLLDPRPFVSDPDNVFSELALATNASGEISYGGPADPYLVLTFPAAGAPYVVSVNLTATDPGGLVGWTVLTISVGDNAPPTLTNLSLLPEALGFPEDTRLADALELGRFFVDLDGPMTFSVEGAVQVNVTIDAGGRLSLSAVANWAGSETIRIIARDAQGAWAAISLRIDVSPVNDPPVFTAPQGVVRTVPPRSWTFSLSPFVSDVDTPLSDLGLSAGPAEFVQAAGLTLIFVVPKGVSEVIVSVSLSDGDSTVSGQFTVELRRSIAELIGYPWSFPLVLGAAAAAGWYASRWLPRAYRLETLFLIHNDGRLITHQASEAVATVDKDVLSAMLTAVQEFVRDSFQAKEEGLKRLEIGHRRVLIEKGPSVYLALIYSGTPPEETFPTMQALLNDIELRYLGKLARWDGRLRSLPGVEEMLRSLISGRYQPGAWRAEEELGPEEWREVIQGDI